MKYNLTFAQKLQLPFLYLLWFFHTDPEKRKSWHHVKKGMEKHDHIFTVPHKERGYDFLKCSHEGCNLVTTNDKRLL